MALKTLALSQAGWSGGHRGGSTTAGTSVTSRGVKVISDHLPPQEKQGFGRQGSSPFQAEAAASCLQSMGRALQLFHPAGINHGCQIQTTEHELVPLCRARGLLNVAVSKLRALAVPSVPPLYCQAVGDALGCRAASKEMEREITSSLCQ